MAKGMWVGVSGVARKIKNYWIGVDSSGYRLLFNVPTGDKINIGGDLFTVVGHSVTKNYMGFSGLGTILWHDEPETTSPVSWSVPVVTSAINDTITSMAFTNTYTPQGSKSGKFAVINDSFARNILGSNANRLRYYNGTAVSYWVGGAHTGYEYIEKAWDADGNPIEDDYYNWFDTSYPYVEADGSIRGYVYDTAAEHMSSPPNGLEADIDSHYKHYYFYACEVDGNTKVTFNANTDYWELWSE